ncbi:MAG: CapA family protein [Lachnospiraceae bacterium]|jgi:poly-gamma-glutamate synthesis protein (capsule biosynthesis protein)|nr:CapA family protein [Lachnospiraceae bacterium]
MGRLEYYDDEGSCRQTRTARTAGKKYHSTDSAPTRTFLMTFIGVILVGALFLFAYAYVNSSDERAEGENTWEAIGEELIPIVSPEVSAADSNPLTSGIDMTGAVPTSSSNIMKTTGGFYALTSTQQADSITLGFGGDILFDTRYAAGSAIASRGVEGCFSKDVLDVMRYSDVFMVNNEFPYSRAGSPLDNKKYTFRADPSSAAYLQGMGVDIVSLANNHSFDYGQQALLDTLDTLDAMGMPHTGAGHNSAEAEQPVYFYAGGLRIAVVNATQIERTPSPPTRGADAAAPGVFRCFTDAENEELLRVIRNAKTAADYVIVYIHWGTEKQTQPDWYQTSRVQGIVDAGADLIVGDHPHCLEPLAYVGNTPVIYSLGNFLFTSFTQDTGVLQVTLQLSTKQVTQLRFVPMVQVNCSVKAAAGNDRQRILSNMRSWSSGVTIDDNGIISRQ